VGGRALEGGVERARAGVPGAGDGAARRGVDGRHAIIGRVSPPILAHNAFVRATLTNFFFSLSLNGYVLLPLHIHALGGTEVAIGVVMGVYSAVGIVCQPLVGPGVDAVGRRLVMVSGTGLV